MGRQTNGNKIVQKIRVTQRAVQPSDAPPTFNRDINELQKNIQASLDYADSVATPEPAPDVSIDLAAIEKKRQRRQQVLSSPRTQRALPAP